MKPDDFKKELLNQLIPSKYKKIVTKGIPESWLVLKKGAYVFACVPFSEVDPQDYKNSYVKNILRKSLNALPVIFEKGAFILYFGERNSWISNYKNFKVDKTALRPIIVQAVHFFDIDTGENFNSRTSWGPVKFGFCGPTIAKLESIGNSIKNQK